MPKSIKQDPRAAVKLRINEIMAGYMSLAFDITHLPEGSHGELVRLISCTNHMLNVALALAAAEGIAGEAVTKALDIGEESATALIKQSMKSVAGRSAQ
jgi:hypothetical protein